MTTTILDFLPYEIHLKVIDHLKDPDDLISYLTTIPLLYPHMASYIRIITYSEKKVQFDATNIPKDCFVTGDQLCDHKALDRVFDEFKGVVILDCTTTFFTFLDISVVLKKIQQVIQKSPRSLTLKVNIRAPKAGVSFTPTYITNAKLLLTYLMEVPIDKITHFSIPLNHKISVDGADSVLDLLDNTPTADVDDVKELIVERHLIKRGILDISDHPKLESLKIVGVRSRFRFHDGFILPETLKIDRSGINFRPTTQMCQNLKYLDVNHRWTPKSLEDFDEDDFRRNDNNIDTLGGFDAPKLKEVSLTFLGHGINAVNNIRAPSLEKLFVRQLGLMAFNLGNIDAPNLESLYVKASTLACEGIDVFPSLKRFFISAGSIDNHLHNIYRNREARRYYFLENSVVGEIENGQHHLLDGLNMKNLKSLFLKGFPRWSEYPTSALFPRLKKLKIVYDQTLGTFPKLNAPELEVLVIQGCANLRNLDNLAENYPKLKYLRLEEVEKTIHFKDWFKKDLEFLSIDAASLKFSRCLFPKLQRLRIYSTGSRGQPPKDVQIFDFKDIIAPRLTDLALICPYWKFGGKFSDIFESMYYQFLKSYLIKVQNLVTGSWPEGLDMISIENSEKIGYRYRC
ncbi:hypothetical protein BN7_2750 [Wickerhamomyces ciferrii]|uniref:Uncharacterized protein n=1 Tax=Wickerhamomyces ciferrii (strain ATCC 14091 / BCRC 22168 / CBS 111 / JCM 3599 / NBRC 0793 / NRRL Y-1031 F-60-10) TaxID=1206466 RepID=K0KPV1_WICCF|nr:uncharacterized protein BN7_2750 [Wickerhamomyces ciferrii]CCH43203.1 hypothetical protein BN7_2750 [Wickerhamomyces ciferrii]